MEFPEKSPTLSFSLVIFRDSAIDAYLTFILGIDVDLSRNVISFLGEKNTHNLEVTFPVLFLTL